MGANPILIQNKGAEPKYSKTAKEPFGSFAVDNLF